MGNEIVENDILGTHTRTRSPTLAVNVVFVVVERLVGERVLQGEEVLRLLPDLIILDPLLVSLLDEAIGRPGRVALVQVRLDHFKRKDTLNRKLLLAFLTIVLSLQEILPLISNALVPGPIECN